MVQGPNGKYIQDAHTLQEKYLAKLDPAYLQEPNKHCCSPRSSQRNPCGTLSNHLKANFYLEHIFDFVCLPRDTFLPQCLSQSSNTPRALPGLPFSSQALEPPREHCSNLLLNSENTSGIIGPDIYMFFPY